MSEHDQICDTMFIDRDHIEQTTCSNVEAVREEDKYEAPGMMNDNLSNCRKEEQELYANKTILHQDNEAEIESTARLDSLQREVTSSEDHDDKSSSGIKHDASMTNRQMGTNESNDDNILNVSEENKET